MSFPIDTFKLREYVSMQLALLTQRHLLAIKTIVKCNSHSHINSRSKFIYSYKCINTNRLPSLQFQEVQHWVNFILTRMHSNRMRTICCSGRHLGVGCMLCQGGPPRRGVCPGGCLPNIPMDRMTDTCKNITLPQLHCVRY